MQRISRKWRPPLALVIGGGLAGVLATPLIDIVYFRLWGNVLGWGEAALLVGCIAVVGSCYLQEALPEAAQIEITTSGEALVLLPMADLNAILVQLIQNAVAHNARKIELSWDGRVMRVVDDGDGVDHGNRDRIFDPFFTSRRETGGTGMGLAVVRSLLSAHGGRIELTESPAGAAFDIRLPS